MSGDIHALAGAYVLDAVDDIERAAFDRHLRECETCAADVAEFRETAAFLAEPTWSAPPPGMRENVLARVRATPQVGAERPPASRSALGRGGVGAGGVEVGTQTAVARWRRRTAITVAAAVVVAAAGVVSYTIQEQQVRRERAVTASVQSVLGAPDAVVRSSDVDGGGRMTLVVSRSLDRGVVVLDATPPGDDRSYQLWRIAAGGPVDAGAVDAGVGTTTRVIDGIGDAEAVALTVEPAGGSETPTFPIKADIATT